VRLGSDHPGWLSQADYDVARGLVPIVCVDLLPARFLTLERDERELALIVRDDAEGGERYALVGGGVLRGETIDDACRRHLIETLGSAVSWERHFDAPDTILEYFPDGRPGYGIDTRKHSVGLTYLVDVSGNVAAGGEASAVAWFPESRLPRRSEFAFRQWLAVEDLLGLTLAE
jgi:ADP-ribose pyrophosphatase YjhB (NUDIX family)